MTYKPGEVSNYLDIKPSTLRRYARLFAEYLSPSAQGRRRKYTDQDLEILQKIKTLAGDGMPIAEIGPLLAEMPIDHETVIDGDQAATSGSSIVPMEIRRELESISKRDEVTNDKLDQILERLERMEYKPSIWDRITGRNQPE